MANFTEDFQSFMYPNMEMLTQFTEQSLSIIDHSNLSYNNSFAPLIPSDSFFYQSQAPDFPGNWGESFPGIFHQTNQDNPLPISQSTVTSENEVHESRKRKAMDVSAESSRNANSSSPIKNQKNSCGRKKKMKSMNGKEEQKPKEVVHVRARRGQATDNHSLAERVRRGKINERLRSLQDIVPGCYKTMGMALMLDEIISYVQSLQNQVEFLSMKLTAASTFYDFNSETDAIDTMQRAKANEAKELERLMRDGSGGVGVGCSHLTWPF